MGLYSGMIAPDNYVNLAETDRQLLRHVAGDTPGVVGLDDFMVEATTGLNLTARAGRAFVEGKSATSQGFYIAWADTVTPIAIAPNGAQPRIDRIVLVVRDSQYGALPSGKTPGPEILAVPGTPGTTPAAPTDSAVTEYVGPGGWLELATVAVAASATTIIQTNITTKRNFTFSKRYVDQAGPKWSGVLLTDVGVNTGVSFVPNWTNEYMLGGMKRNDRTIVVPRTGLYRVSAQGCWSSNGNGYRQVRITKNPTAAGNSGLSGGTLLTHFNLSAEGGQTEHVAVDKTVPLLAGDRLAASYFHNAGAAVTVIGVGGYFTYFQVAWAGESS